MNRHQRRKAKALHGETRMVGPDEAQEMLGGGHQCAWDGCAALYHGPQPEGWRNLLVFWSAGPIRRITDIPGGTWDRDGVLCPEHVRQLDGLLKDIGQRLKGPPAGSA